MLLSNIVPTQLPPACLMFRHAVRLHSERLFNVCKQLCILNTCDLSSGTSTATIVMLSQLHSIASRIAFNVGLCNYVPFLRFLGRAGG